MALELLQFIAMNTMIFLLSFFVFSAARANEPAIYGQLLLEDQTEELQTPFRLDMSAGFDVTNPYLNSYNFGLMGLWNVHPIFSVGVETLAFSSGRSRYNQAIQNEVNVFGISANEDRPRYEAFAVAKAKLLQGRVNLLGSGALPFLFNVKVGTGLLWLEDGHSVGASTWGFESQLYFSQRWGASLKFDQDVQGFASRANYIYRNRLGLGATYLF